MALESPQLKIQGDCSFSSVIKRALDSELEEQGHHPSSAPDA